MNTPEPINIADEQTLRQDELREGYLKWLSRHEVENQEQKAPLRETPSRHNVCGWNVASS